MSTSPASGLAHGAPQEPNLPQILKVLDRSLPAAYSNSTDAMLLANGFNRLRRCTNDYSCNTTPRRKRPGGGGSGPVGQPFYNKLI